jgi:hypothetical protein
MRSWGLRGLIALAVVAAAMGAWSLTASPTEAAVFGPGVWVYYSNAAYTTVVGAKGTGCCGEIINWGITTKWKRFEKIYCLDVLCPN